MKYATLIFENGLLIIKQTSFNSKTLINKLVDLYDRLSKVCKQEKDFRRQKIISILNTTVPVYVLETIYFKESTISK